MKIEFTNSDRTEAIVTVGWFRKRKYKVALRNAGRDALEWCYIAPTSYLKVEHETALKLEATMFELPKLPPAKVHCE